MHLNRHLWVLILPLFGATPALSLSTEYVFVELGDAGMTSVAAGINNFGEVAGTQGAYPNETAFIWDPWRGLRLLGTLGGAASLSHAISGAGCVVGESDGSVQTFHAFIWCEGTNMTDITPNQSYGSAWGINKLGQVIGQVN